FAFSYQRNSKLNSPGFSKALLCSSGKALFLHLAMATAGAASQAAPLDELRSLSQLRNVDLAKLKNGEIISVRGPVGAFPRGIPRERCYFIGAPLDVVLRALLHWDPLPHKDLKVRRYREYSLPPGPNAFQMMQLDPTVAGDRWLLEETVRVSQGAPAGGGLHLTKDEAALLYRKSMGPSEAWR